MILIITTLILITFAAAICLPQATAHLTSTPNLILVNCDDDDDDVHLDDDDNYDDFDFIMPLTSHMLERPCSGYVCLFSLKNPSFPEYICKTNSGVSTQIMREICSYLQSDVPFRLCALISTLTTQT